MTNILNTGRKHARTLRGRALTMELTTTVDTADKAVWQCPKGVYRVVYAQQFKGADPSPGYAAMVLRANGYAQTYWEFIGGWLKKYDNEQAALAACEAEYESQTLIDALRRHLERPARKFAHKLAKQKARWEKAAAEFEKAKDKLSLAQQQLDDAEQALADAQASKPDSPGKQPEVAAAVSAAVAEATPAPKKKRARKTIKLRAKKKPAKKTTKKKAKPVAAKRGKRKAA